ncbi:MBOAT family O-acyltransferase [Poriferisphaera sp. WC338]|uniref:MBOAT family O-acyltransferase n=1 Tax=Poriferisphaera sp. WC338 TaxID=3425129 RepID=UPI003D81A86D
MIFSSYSFVLLFLPVVLIGFAITSRLPYRRAPFIFLVIASLIYCGYWRFADLLPLAASIIINFTLGRFISSTQKPLHKNLLLALGITFNLGLLIYFKYASLLTETTNTLLGITWTVPAIVLPIAISFYTFQQIAYLFDAKNNLTHEYHFIDYCLFVTFFPQLIAGPIVHHADMLPQFQNRKLQLNAPDFTVGISLFIFGLSKKVLIADEFSLMAAKAFTPESSTLTFVAAWLGATAYAIQIYFDFSGYSDMALGIARFFGIKLPLNFNSPYRATNIIEFWRRWHITLSTFLRDYLYFPLGGNRKGHARRYLNLFITMLLGGLWHGAAWVFMLWGGLHGLYLCINHAFHKLFPNRPTSALPYIIAARSITLLAVILAWVLFRADSLSQASDFFTAMFGLNGFALAHPFKSSRIILLILMIALVTIMPNIQTMMRQYRPHHGRKLKWDGIPALATWKWRPEPFWVIILVVLFTASILQMSRAGEFIYYRF